MSASSLSKTKNVVLAITTVALSIFGFQYAYAYEITEVAVDEVGDFILEPAKIDVFVSAGETVTETLRIINRTGETLKFTVDIEDTTGSKEGSRAIVLLGDERGPYSLRDYIRPETNEFTLKSKQQISLPVRISVPADAEPGGLYGTVLISSADVSRVEGENGAAGGATTISRLGALFFVRVSGDVAEDGALEDFGLKENKTLFYDEGPSGFHLVFNNNGSVHLNPYGFITVSNFAGITVDEIEVTPYFAMPDSVRFREVKYDSGVLLGRYKAVAQINRGYDDIIDERSVVFWVIPWKLILAGFAIILFIIFVVRWFAVNFELKRKA